MKLYTSPTSPYARMVRMVVHERGLGTRVEEVRLDPFADPPALAQANPLGKVPVLVTADGAALIDSRVICAFLDTLGDAAPLIPEAPRAWRVTAGQALAVGIMDALFLIVIERRRPEAAQSEVWQARWRAAVLRAADAIEADVGVFGESFSAAHVTLGAALGYADFRTPDIDWRAGRPRLADWYAWMAERPSMQATRPDP